MIVFMLGINYKYMKPRLPRSFANNSYPDKAKIILYIHGNVRVPLAMPPGPGNRAPLVGDN